MKLNKKVLVILSSLLCMSLCACSKKGNTESVGFGVLEDTKEEQSKSFGESIDLESSSATDEFSINKEITLDNNENNISSEISTEELSEDEKSLEQAEKEAESFLYTSIDGSVKDIREEAGYIGLLKYIDSYNDIGGVDLIANSPREETKDFLKMTYCFATEEEIDSVLDIIYKGSKEEKQKLEEDALHTREGYVYTDEGWKNIYEETNAERERRDIGENGGGYTPDNSFENVEIYAY